MKLRNKKTGKVIEWFNNTDGIFPNTLAELNEKWEDYEEPKSGIRDVWFPDVIEGQNNVVISFETKEDAEKAVEKLKAWKRLRDKGFRFNKWTIPEEPKTTHIKLVIESEMDVPDSPYDLDLLFEGKE